MVYTGKDLCQALNTHLWSKRDRIRTVRAQETELGRKARSAPAKKLASRRRRNPVRENEIQNEKAEENLEHQAFTRAEEGSHNTDTTH